jgi:hypothetical protein
MHVKDPIEVNDTIGVIDVKTIKEVSGVPHDIRK